MMTVRDLSQILFTCDPDSEVVLVNTLDEGNGMLYDVYCGEATTKRLDNTKGDNVINSNSIKLGQSVTILTSHGPNRW